MIAGGDRESWPREGNRPVYFWMNLNSGKTLRLPTGWDLSYFFSGPASCSLWQDLQERFLST